MIKLLALLALWASAAPALAAELDAADRAEVVRNAAALLEERYVDPERGKRIARELRRAASKWSGIREPRAFARAVTDWLRSTTGDGHLGLSHSETPIANEAAEAGFTAAEMQKYYGAHVNHGVEKIERLAGNIILLDLRVFPPGDMGGEVIAAAMNVAAQGDALIIDLRTNGGGSDVPLVAGYLLDGGQPLSGTYDRPTDTLRASVSPAWVPGRRFGSKKPLFILTSKRTFSAAEALAYDLQALKRAVIVGERTGGGAHPYHYRRVHAHFALDLPEGKSINPITGGNWQGVGVKPDVEVPAADALDKALALARAAIAKGR